MKKKTADTFNYLLSLIYPNRCCFCSELIDPFENICRVCEDTLPFISGEICYSCGAEKSRCHCKKSRSHYFEKVCAPLYYEGNVRECIHDFKFRDNKMAYKCLSSLMAECCKKRYDDIKFDYVTFVPMRKKNLRKRGFNQSGLLAKSVADSIGVTYVEDLLIKLFDTENQHDCGYFERMGNLFGVFDVNEKYDIKGKNILLTDDIVTSGITLSECGKMLYLNGAEHVYCIAAALKCDKEE